MFEIQVFLLQCKFQCKNKSHFDHQVQVVQEALDKASLTERDLSAVAVTIGPGLSLCLRGNCE